VRGALEGKSVVAVAAGREHALVATADGQVFSFGGGRAVLGRAGAAAQPALVTGPLAGQVVQHVAAGEVSMRLLQAVICMVDLVCATFGLQ
jgi:alpha-tubulin suppressor-like RCC1 family protein